MGDSNIVAFTVYITALVLIALNAWFLLSGHFAPAHATADFEFKDYAALLLTVVTVIIAVLGIGIAILAFWGYKEIVHGAKAHAQKAAIEKIGDHLRGEKFAADVKEILDALYRESALGKIAAKPVGGDSNGSTGFSKLPGRGDGAAPKA